MEHKSNLICAIAFTLALLTTGTATAQDKVYMTSGKIQEGKVTEVGTFDVKMLQSNHPDGPVYVYRVKDVDSIVYANGLKDELQGVIHKKELLKNIPERNTWTFDLLGFTFLSVSQSYERRLKNEFMGIRVPLYIGFVGGSIAGVGLFIPRQGVFYPEDGGVDNGGFSIASGVNPKFYLFNRRRVRAFIGPEATIGYSQYKYYPIYPTYSVVSYGTVAFTGKAGLMINPIDLFNITIDGGAGAGDIFGSQSPLGWVGLWHIGLSLGTNF